ncbi:MAG: adenylyl-sulfate kinase [Alicyclobacillus herbarius]|uniref:adenylyl-sulfate kinase n=1 Tax=Alicyclobacillus herbarius TaxID=122960 RepID=UPI00235722B9|nr:adenylyl-sulfate kinase [Alicyclobacillus herbarius]MCL6632761.1 adenylyl-sulfate kinase [Alicyclobacillus herbarius]
MNSCAGANSRGLIVWLTGLSGAGKSTLAAAVTEALGRDGVPAYWLDADNIRRGLNADLGFSPADRKENVRRIAEVARLFADAGICAVVSCIAPFRADRQWVRERCNPHPFLLVYVRCPLTVCQARDPKGLYRRALRGDLPDFTGLHQPYEEPEDAECVVDTDRESVATSTARVLATIRGQLNAC